MQLLAIYNDLHATIEAPMFPPYLLCREEKKLQHNENDDKALLIQFSCSASNIWCCYTSSQILKTITKMSRD